MIPYALSSDQHCHDWSQFSKVGADGVNSRLRVILNELERSAAGILAIGGKRLLLAGDLFHVRGKIDPEVLNPTIEAFKRICATGVEVYAIAGNHDLKGRASNKLGNAMQSLDEIEGFTAIVEPLVMDDVVMIPWIEDLDELRTVMKAHADKDRDLIIHAPLNGVITGLPDTGLEPAELKALGYARVFVGHYHNHKAFQNGAVYSVGATTHQTWSDPGTAAGFCMVYEDRVEHVPSEAPSFVNIDDPKTIDPVSVGGNYVRLRFQDVDDAELAAAKAALKSCGALDWVDHCSKKREVSRGSSSTQNVTLEVSVVSYVKDHLQCGRLSKKRIATEALDILREARTVGDE